MYNYLERQIAVARSIFSKMPNQLFDMYIRALITDMGIWPFHSCMDFTRNTPWHRVFSVVSLLEQASCSWNLSHISSNPCCITLQSLEDIVRMLQNYDGTLSPLLKVCDFDYEHCRMSTEYHIQQLLNHETYDLPVVVYPIAGQFQILDGNHRIGAALRLRTITGRSYSIPAWIAEV